MGPLLPGHGRPRSDGSRSDSLRKDRAMSRRREDNRCLPPMEAQSQRLLDAVARLQFSHQAGVETADLLDAFLGELLALTGSSRAAVAEVSTGGRGRSLFEPT